MKINSYVKSFDGREYKCSEIYLPKTTLLIIATDKGFVMCGALDTDIYSSPKMVERKVYCAKAIGVKNIDELYNARVASASLAFYELGLKDGMEIKEALTLI